LSLCPWYDNAIPLRMITGCDSDIVYVSVLGLVVSGWKA
jgi:hypothetical protein